MYEKLAHFLTWCDWLHFFDDLPFDVLVDVFVFFYFPNVIAKCR